MLGSGLAGFFSSLLVNSGHNFSICSFCVGDCHPRPQTALTSLSLAFANAHIWLQTLSGFPRGSLLVSSLASSSGGSFPIAKLRLPFSYALYSELVDV